MAMEGLGQQVLRAARQDQHGAGPAMELLDLGIGGAIAGEDRQNADPGFFEHGAGGQRVFGQAQHAGGGMAAVRKGGQQLVLRVFGIAAAGGVEEQPQGTGYRIRHRVFGRIVELLRSG